eukprot:m.62878 g.62878  ORF g.62878 m.62878 type:complete len:293 (-) comp16317_c0_seq2:210-1088(-)
MDLDPCPGRYCGRPAPDEPCGPCPRGYRTDGTLCQECTEEMDHYEALFCAAMLLLVYAVGVAGVLRPQRQPVPLKFRLLLGFVVTLETLMAGIMAVLCTPPLGVGARVNSCGIQQPGDWYPALQNPRPDHVHTIHCTSEVVFPLLTIVLIFDAFALLLVLLVRLPISAYVCNHAGADSVYYTLYALPIHVAVHVMLGGPLYYAFPYILIVFCVAWTVVDLSGISNIESMNHKVAFMVLRHIIGAYALMAVFLFFDLPNGIVTMLFAPILPPLIYALTEPITDPSTLHPMFLN